MSYRQIEKLAKEKPNITRRDRVSEEILIELQHSQNLHSDSHFISTDEITDDSTMESEVVQEPTVSKCGRKRKRGNQNSKEEQKALPVSKKAKKESVDHTLNSTFSVDEQMFQQQQNQLLEKQQQQQQQLQEQQQQQQLQEQQQLQKQLRKQEILLQLKQLREEVQQLQQEKQQIQQKMEELQQQQQQLQEEQQQLEQLRQQLQLSIQALRKMKYKKCHKLEKFGRNA